jgi:predicted Zn finger-like uncharacterized protein
MIEIQCTSCHTRYRIDERVLPADTPTFKCSRCGHVFTADPVAAKKSAEASAKQHPRVSSQRSDAKPGIVGASNALKSGAAAPKALAPEPPPKPSGSEALKTATPDANAAASKPASGTEAKPPPLKPYIRNQRPTVFDRKPEAPPPKPFVQTDPAIDTEAIAQIKESVEAPKPPPDAAKDANDDRGDNLEFDFNDDSEHELGSESEPAPADAERWSVGDNAIDETEPPPKPAFGRGLPDPGFSRGEPAPIGRGTIPQYAGQPPMQRSTLPDERAFIERAEMHSARSFIGLFFVVALVFVAVTLVIYAIPNASADILRRMPVIGPEFVQPTPVENLVSVSDVQSTYQRVKGGHNALVMTGTVKNNSTVPLHTIQIGVRLLDPEQKPVASSAVYVGTTVSPHMLSEMTPHELEFLQKLDPQKNFVLEPGHAAPFLMVFIDPPQNLGHVSVAIAKAEPPASTTTSEANAH